MQSARRAVICCALSGAAACFTPVSAAPLTPGNILVLRVGDGSRAPATGTYPIFLDEFMADGTAVQSISVPSTGTDFMVLNPNATTEGILKQSDNGQYFTFGGYKRAVGGTASPSNDASTATPRVLGRVDFSGTVNVGPGLTDAFSAQSLRSVASDDGTNYWINGGAGGVRYVSGINATTSTQIENRNMRSTQVAGGDLYVSTGAGTTRGVQKFSGKPTAAAAPTVTITNFAATDATQDFIALDVDSSVAGIDTVYALNNVAGTIAKFTSTDGTTWTPRGTVSSNGAIDMSGAVTANGVALYATSLPAALTTPNVLMSMTDNSGFGNNISGSLSTIATVGTNNVFRGVAVIVPEPGTARLLVAAAAMFVRRRASGK